VQCFHRLCRHLNGKCERLIDRQRALTGKPIGERFTFQVFEHQLIEIAVAAEVVNRADMRIVQRGDGARLAFKTASRFRISRARQNFDGNGPLQSRVARTIHVGHATGTQRPHDFVWTQACASLKRHAARILPELQTYLIAGERPDELV
jgi:hypothetical protein